MRMLRGWLVLIAVLANMCCEGFDSPAPVLAPSSSKTPSSSDDTSTGNGDNGTGDSPQLPTSKDVDDTINIGTDAGMANEDGEGGEQDDPGSSASAASSDTSDSEDDLSTPIIVLAVLLAALILGNIITCYVCAKNRNKKARPPPLPPAGNRGRSQPGSPPPLYGPEDPVGNARDELEEERKRRIQAEALIQRATPGGMRMSDFPKVRDVIQHVEQLTPIVLQWTGKACAIAGSDSALPMTMQSILVQTFVVCRDEVGRCMGNRMQALSEFLGGKEPVKLGGDMMNLDTSYVLYECLARNYQSIVPVQPDNMNALATDILQRGGGSADKHLAKKMISGDAWALFEDVMQRYILILVECELQNGPMRFNDDVGKETTFDPFDHRDWAPHSAAPDGQQCCIVFPGFTPHEGRPPSNTKIGVVRVNT